MTLAHRHPLTFLGSPKSTEFATVLIAALFLLKNGWQTRKGDRLWRHPRKQLWMSLEEAVALEGGRAKKRKAKLEELMERLNSGRAATCVDASAEPPVLRCRGCGAQQALELPISSSRFSTLGTRFEKEHKGCDKETSA